MSTYNPNIIGVPLKKSSAAGMAAFLEGLKELDEDEIEAMLRKLRALTAAIENRVEYTQRQATPLADSRLKNDGGTRVAKAGAVLSRWATGRWG